MGLKLPRGSPPPFGAFIIEVTSRCNHACRHCYNVRKNPRPYPGGELPTARMIELFDRLLDETDARLLTLSGDPCGLEPFLERFPAQPVKPVQGDK